MIQSCTTEHNRSRLRWEAFSHSGITSDTNLYGRLIGVMWNELSFPRFERRHDDSKPAYLDRAPDVLIEGYH